MQEPPDRAQARLDGLCQPIGGPDRQTSREITLAAWAMQGTVLERHSVHDRKRRRRDEIPYRETIGDLDLFIAINQRVQENHEIIQ